MSKKVISFIMALCLLIGMLDVSVLAALAAGHSAVNSSGDVFLGNGKMELGINQYGSFGSRGRAPSGFHPWSSFGCIGLVSAPWGDYRDYFLPGTVDEGFVFYWGGREQAMVSSTDIGDVTTSNVDSEGTSNTSSGDTLSAVTVGTANDKLSYTQTISFKDDEGFATVTVALTNISSDTLTGVEYVRGFDPDQGFDGASTSNYYNQDTDGTVWIVATPMYKQGIYESVDVFAQGITAPFIFMAPASTEYTVVPVHQTVGWSGYSSFKDVTATSATYNLNRSRYADEGIGLRFRCGDIAPRETVTITYYMSLDTDTANAFDALKGAIAGSGLTSSTGEITLNLTVQAESITVKVDGVTMVADVDYTISGIETLTPTVLFAEHARLTSGSEITIELLFPGESTPQILVVPNHIPEAFAVTVASGITGGTVTVDKSEAAPDDSVTVTVTPATGYSLDKLTVDGADVTAGVAGGKYVFSMPAKEVEVNASFKLLTYTVTFFDQNGTKLKEETVNYGAAATAPVPPEKAGYIFAGWDTAFDNVKDNLTVTAKWTEKAVVTINQTAQTYPYNSAAQAFAIKGTALTGFIVKYQQNGDDVTPVNAGAYDVVITRAEDSVYSQFALTLPGALVITPAKVTKPAADTTVFTYNGNEQTFAVADSDLYTVSGNKRTLAGSQTVTVALKDKTNYTWADGTTADLEFTFTIAKATPAVTVPTGLTATYGDTLAGVSLPACWAWKDAATTPVGNAGENTFVAIYTHPTNAANHNQVEAAVVIEVNPKVVTATVAVVGENFTFNSSAHTPGVTVKDGAISIPDSEYTVTYSNNVNAGTAVVTITDKDGGNYIVTGTATFAIAKKTSSALAGVEREFMRTIASTGNQIDVGAMLPNDHGTVTYTITSGSYAVLENVAVDANGKLVFDTKTSAAAASETITVKVEMQNYTDVILTVSVILNDKTPQTITGVSAVSGLIYNGSAQQGYIGTPVSEKYTGSYEIIYTGRSNTYNSSVAPTNAGDYTVTFKIPDTDLYYSGNVSINFTIAKAKATVTADNKETYIGTFMPKLTYTVTGLIGNDTISVALTCDATTYAAGTTPIIVSAVDPNGNYEITAVNATLIVKYYIYYPIVIPTYPPVIYTGEGGSASVSPAAPELGDIVIITPVPDSRKEVAAIVVGDMNGKPVALTDNGDGTYYFKQPIGTATIIVTFKDSKPAVSDCIQDNSCPIHQYDDLELNAWYHDGVHFCVENGLMNGVDMDTFAPGAVTSRAMLVTILWRLEGQPIVDDSMHFADVEEDMWYTEAIRWAASKGIVNGYSTENFGPNDSVTREQFVTIMYRYAEKTGHDVSGGESGDLLSYHDVAGVSDWASLAMQWACDAGLIQGVADGDLLNLVPQGDANRAQVATILYRYCDAIAKMGN